MSRVPSPLSGQLGAFVRRARVNAFELQTVGSTRLENRIQSLFGVSRIEDLPPSMQQVIAQDRALGGGGGSGPLTIINPFTNDDLTPDQQKAAANRIAIQQGAVAPFPEVQQPQEQNSLQESVRQAASSMQPLVQDGTLTPKGAQSITRSVALDRVLDANEQRKAARDVKAVLNQFRTKQLGRHQVSKTMDRIQAEHGNESLNLIPEWRELTNTNEQFQVQLEEAKKAKAAKHGLPVDAFKIDQATGTIVRDDEWFQIDAYKTKKNTEEAKPALELAAAQRKSAGNNMQLRLKIADASRQVNSKINPKQAVEQYAIEVGEINRQFISELPGTDTGGGAAGRPAPASTAQVAIPGLPAGVPLFGEFSDINALRSANPPKNSYFTVGGLLGRRRADGKYETVQ